MEEIIKDIELVYSLARMNVATNNPLDENALIKLIESKKRLIDLIKKIEK